MSAQLSPPTLLQVKQVQPQPAAAPSGAPAGQAHEGQVAPGPGAEGEAQPPSAMPSFLMLIAIFAIFYFIGIRPQQKQAKEHKELVKSLGPGDKVVTSSGILGRITALDDTIVTLEVDKNTRLKILRDHVQGRQKDSKDNAAASARRR